MKIYIAGHLGMVGSALLRELEAYADPVELITRPHSTLDLTDQSAVMRFFQSEQLDQVYIAAAKVGGIVANSRYPADFIYQNLMIQTNIVQSAFVSGVKKLLLLGSSCIYPRHAPQPMPEAALLSGALEPTNEPYAIAKIAGIKLCESYNRQYGDSHGVDYRCVMPANLYGPNDRYHPENSHVIPALIRRFHEAKMLEEQTVTVWGTGTPRREFVYVDDMAAASIFVMNLDKETYASQTTPMQSHINVGSGQDYTIEALAYMVAKTVGYNGAIEFDTSRPDGPPQKLMDNKRLLSLGWQPTVSLAEGLSLTYNDFKRVYSNAR